MAALNEIKNALPAIQSLDETRRGELQDVVTEVEAEVVRPKPNQTRIGALLSMILASIQGVAALQTAYDTILSILQALGIVVS